MAPIITIMTTWSRHVSRSPWSIEGGSLEVARFMAPRDRHHEGRISALVRRGDYQGAMAMLNDATRLPALWRWYAAGRLSRNQLNGLLRGWWSSTHTSLSLEQWQIIDMFDSAGFVRNARLPAGRLTIYRGQRAEAEIGVCWTLNEAVAAKFALYHTDRGQSVVLSTTTESSAILGYLKDRDEDEVIVDPDCLGEIQSQPLNDRLRQLGERFLAEVAAKNASFSLEESPRRRKARPIVGHRPDVVGLETQKGPNQWAHSDAQSQPRSSP
jgi:hypothetical protein